MTGYYAGFCTGDVTPLETGNLDVAIACFHQSVQRQREFPDTRQISIHGNTSMSRERDTVNGGAIVVVSIRLSRRFTTRVEMT